MPMFDDVVRDEVPGLNLQYAYVDHAGIPRTRKDAPIVRTPCPAALDFDADPADWCVDGRVKGMRAAGKQCPICKGKGEVWKVYIRVTTYISCLEDTTNVTKWRQRIAFRALARDPELILSLRNVDWSTFEEQETKRYLNGLADRMHDIGGGEDAADRGTHLHELSAEIDSGRPLPDHTYVKSKDMRIDVSLQDRADLAAWRRCVDELGVEILAVEKFVVLDELTVAGTLDRIFRWVGKSPCDQCDLPWIGDIKTGAVTYGGGKMPQQLAIYARAKGYDPETGERTDQELCTHRGLIVNLVAGTGTAECYVADLEAGWESVMLSKRVREHRNESKHHLWPLELTA